jgi:hypothetical protein
MLQNTHRIRETAAAPCQNHNRRASSITRVETKGSTGQQGVGDDGADSKEQDSTSGVTATVGVMLDFSSGLQNDSHEAKKPTVQKQTSSKNLYIKFPLFQF